MRAGTLVGEDKFGNKYYENPEYFYGMSNYCLYGCNSNSLNIVLHVLGSLG